MSGIKTPASVIASVKSRLEACRSRLKWSEQRAISIQEDLAGAQADITDCTTAIRELEGWLKAVDESDEPGV
jgi:hypothetical protein